MKNFKGWRINISFSLPVIEIFLLHKNYQNKLFNPTCITRILFIRIFEDESFIKSIVKPCPIREEPWRWSNKKDVCVNLEKKIAGFIYGAKTQQFQFYGRSKCTQHFDHNFCNCYQVRWTARTGVFYHFDKCR